MVTIKTPAEIKILAEGGNILASILNSVAEKVRSDISGKELDDYAKILIKKAGASPAFLGYKPSGSNIAYPAALCVSVNNEVVHGIPLPEKILKEGDIVSLDLGLEYKKLFTDMAVTVGVGKISPAAKNLIDVTKKSLSMGEAVLKNGAATGDYGFTVQSFVEKAGYSVIRDLVGHGVGYSVHEDPDIANWGKKGQGFKLKEGMVLALEPMVCQGQDEVVLSEDGWTWQIKDGFNAVHFEHTVAVEKNGCKILTKL